MNGLLSHNLLFWMRLCFCRDPVVIRLDRSDLLNLRFLLGKLRCFKCLPIKTNLSNPNRGIALAMSAKLLVLFFALVVKDQNFLCPALLYNFADNQSTRARAANLALLA